MGKEKLFIWSSRYRKNLGIISYRRTSSDQKFIYKEDSKTISKSIKNSINSFIKRRDFFFNLSVTFSEIYFSVASSTMGFFSFLKKKKCFCFKLISQYKCTYTMDKQFYFLLPISRESIVLRSNFRNGDFDGFTRFEVF